MSSNYLFILLANSWNNTSQRDADYLPFLHIPSVRIKENYWKQNITLGPKV